MAIEIPAPRLSSRETPRQLLHAHFKSIPELPIRGGWGYDEDDAVIIDRNDPIVPRNRPFDGVGIEHVFVEKRIYEELIIFRKRGDAFAGIKWKLIQQGLAGGDGGRRFDVLKFDVTALPEAKWNALKAAWEGPAGFGSADFDVEAHRERHEAATVHYVAEYWFDITSFYGVR